MQEEVTQRTVALCVEATKLSAGMLQQAMKKGLDRYLIHIRPCRRRAG